TIRAVDRAGVASLADATYTWTIDTIAPDTINLMGPPAQTTSTSAAFTFSSDDPQASFECKMDDGVYTVCSSPQTYDGLTTGAHRFEVISVDPAGNVDNSPKAWNWNIVSSPLQVGLVAYYSFESTAFLDRDDSGYGRDLTSMVSAVAISGVAGGAVSLTTGYMLLPDDPALNLADGSFSIIFQTRVASCQAGTTESLVAKANVARLEYGISITENAGQCVASFEVQQPGTGPSEIVFGVSPVADNAWHSIALVVTGQTVSIYVDRKLDASQVLSVNVNDDFYDGQWALGRTGICCGAFTGSLDEVRFYDRALDIAEIAALSSPGSPARWSFADTGQLLCYDNTEAISCPQPGQPFYGQDAQFDHRPISYTVDARIVIDNNTGLVWQRADDGVQRDWAAAKNYCADLELAGLRGWRLPTVKELETLVNLDTFYPAADTAIFDLELSPYHTSTTAAFSPDSVWTVHFERGRVTPKLMTDLGLALCVNGASVADSTAGRFQGSGQATVIDSFTGLEWQQQSDNIGRSWQAGLSYCEQLTLAEYDDWRLPDRRELLSIVDFSNTALPAQFSGPSGYYVSSSSWAAARNYYWAIYFPSGLAYESPKIATSFVRCVRNVNVVQTASTDADGDGLADFYEYNTYGSSVSAEDTDSDGLSDCQEVWHTSRSQCEAPGYTGPFDGGYGSDPTRSDSDADALGDFAEVVTHGTDPVAFDTDADGYGDGDEILAGTDPRTNTSIPAPPDSQIDTYPSDPTTSTTATFTFSSTSPIVDHFECELDGGGFQSCMSPVTYVSLTPRRHYFDVRAVDNAAVAGPVSSYAWEVVDFSAGMTSTSYGVIDASFSGFGGPGVSANYELRSSIGAFASPLSSIDPYSTNYNLQPGIIRKEN
ncbi:MAG: DUF1566 domain-containing protein, partial [Candidatus Zixiibacteriota bacterium]